MRSQALALPPFLFATALALAGSVGAQSAVLVVDDDGGPGVDYVTPHAAIAAAASGDTILVKSGVYSSTTPFLIDGKSLVVTADVGSDVQLVGGIQISNLAPSQSVAITGIRTSSFTSRILVDHCSGPVLIDRCEVGDGSVFTTSVAVVSSSDVTLVDTLVHGQITALEVDASMVYLYGCTLEGGDMKLAIPPTPGGAAVRLVSGFLFASGSSLLGGDADSGAFCGPAAGGAGLEIYGGSAELLDDDILGGAGSVPTSPGCIPGAPGPDLLDPAGGAHVLPGTARGFDVLSPVRSDELGALSFDGQGGDLVWIALSLAQAPAFVPSLTGTLVPAAPPVLAFVGALPPGGQLTFPVSVGPPPGAPGLNVYVQAAFASPTQIVLGDPHAATLLDAAF